MAKDFVKIDGSNIEADLSATQSSAGLMSAADKTKLDGIATGANNFTYTHPTNTARTGVPTANATPGFGGTFNVNQVSNDAAGHVTAITSRTITIPSTLSNGTGTAGLIKTSSTVTSTSGLTACPVISGVPYYKDTDTTYTSLKNPYALTIQGNGTTLTNGTYDGSAAKTVNITPSAIGAMSSINPTGTGSFSLNRKADTDIGENSVTVGTGNTASGMDSFASGYNTTASADSSHAEGENTTASEYGSHAEGYDTTASGHTSHAEGFGTTSSGHSSHAEGYDTTASGSRSHAEGQSTIAASNHQHVQGKYNIEDTSGTYAHIIGNGTSKSARSNAHTVDWDGNAWFAGDVTVGVNNTKVSLEGHTHSYAASSHNHGAGNITSGTLAVARGGTGITSNPSMLTNLGSTSAASVFAASPRPGVTGTLPIGNGGTGATTAATARTNLGFTYSDSVPTTAPSTGAGSIHFVQDTGAPTSVENGGTGATSVEELREKLGFGNIGKACSARSTTQTIIMSTAGTMYTVPLNAWVSRTTEDFTFSGDGIKCPYTGTVLITGGTYIGDQTNAKHGAYVFKNSTEVAAYYFPTVSSVTSTILSVSAGDVIYLKARSSVASASCNGNNSATLLSIVYLK